MEKRARNADRRICSRSVAKINRSNGGKHEVEIHRHHMVAATEAIVLLLGARYCWSTAAVSRDRGVLCTQAGKYEIGACPKKQADDDAVRQRARPETTHPERV